MSRLMRELEKDAARAEISTQEFKERAYLLKNLAAGQVKIGNIYELLAKAYGYGTLAALQSHIVDGVIKRQVDDPLLKTGRAGRIARQK